MKRQIFKGTKKELFDIAKDNGMFEYEHIQTMEELRDIIQKEEGNCMQQVAFSTFHNALTQINFTNKIIRSNIKI